MVVTRGYGSDQLIVTRGYGESGLVAVVWREVIELVSGIVRVIRLVSGI